MKKKVIIIGAGLAGLSLATQLAGEGFLVTILEKENYLGGRASNVIDKKTGDAVPIGPHVFLDKYYNFFKFLDIIHAPRAITFDEKVQGEYIYGTTHYQFKNNPKFDRFHIPPWILEHPLLTWRDKLSTVGILRLLLFTKWSTLKRFDTVTAYAYLRQAGLTDKAINMLFRFIALSLVNLPLEICSAAEFLWLLKKWLIKSPISFGQSTVGLGDLYTGYAKQFVEQRKGKVISGIIVKKIVFQGDKINYLLVEEKGKTKRLTADLYVSTMTPVDLRAILPLDRRFTSFFRHLNAYEGVPYISVNLWFDKKITKKKFWALLHTEDTPDLINTDFYDQSNIYQTKKNYSYITSNIIYSKAFSAMTDEEIVEKTVQELKLAFPRMHARVTQYKVNRIPYVIYMPYPGMWKHKLRHTTPIDNFFLAGDWTEEKTQCMETAVISGFRCAEAILRKYGIEKTIYDPKGL